MGISVVMFLHTAFLPECFGWLSRGTPEIKKKRRRKKNEISLVRAVIVLTSCGFRIPVGADGTRTRSILSTSLSREVKAKQR